MFKALKSFYSKDCSKYLANNPGRVITTDIIASLVAWPLSVTPVNIMSGFKKTGAFPLNPGEVTDRYLAPSHALDSSSASNASSPHDNSLPEKRKFTPEQCKLYEMRFSEGYDLPDALTIRLGC